jgi:hypothetical protein
MSGLDPFDPLDPGHRAQRGRERTAFFRQTNVFPIVVLTMVIFVPLAMWQKPWALPFLGWMAFMPHVLGGVARLANRVFKRDLLIADSSLWAAAICIVLFLVLSALFSTFSLLIVAGVFGLIYAYGLYSGLLLPNDERQ